MNESIVRLDRRVAATLLAVVMLTALIGCTKRTGVTVNFKDGHRIVSDALRLAGTYVDASLPGVLDRSLNGASYYGPASSWDELKFRLNKRLPKNRRFKGLLPCSSTDTSSDGMASEFTRVWYSPENRSRQFAVNAVRDTSLDLIGLVVGEFLVDPDPKIVGRDFPRCVFPIGET